MKDLDERFLILDKDNISNIYIYIYICESVEDL